MRKKSNGAASGTRMLVPEPEKGGPERRRPPVRLFIGVFVAAVLFVALVVSLTGESGGSSQTGKRDTSAASQPPANAGGSGGKTKATRKTDGVPVGYPQSKEGVAAAATNFEIARSSRSYITDKPYRDKLIGQIMAPESVASQITRDDQATAQLIAGFGLQAPKASGLLLRSACLGTRISSFSDQVASVDVWMTSVAGVPTEKAKLPVSARWTTYTYNLQWRDGDWKVTSIASADGPTPLQSDGSSPSSMETFRTAEEEFNAPPYVG
ncbi:hypothetical protein ACIO6T_39660 [Streptomyces sp. NPDC087532]|uniref:hypothetical protein n=1 Tax=Streptomyces sp. NPDC087532 TaxID=3365795 RepID=UPI0037F44DE9